MAKLFWNGEIVFPCCHATKSGSGGGLDSALSSLNGIINH